MLLNPIYTLKMIYIYVYLFNNTLLQKKKLLNTLGIFHNKQYTYTKKKIKKFNWILLKKKKQQHFSYQDLLNNKSFTYSTGKLLPKSLLKLKYLKRSLRSVAVTIQLFKKYKLLEITNISYFFIKNFNKHNYLWLKKYYTLLVPSINFLIFKKSFAFTPKGPKRIKRTVFRSLLKIDKGSM